jgi:hypothetical protein
MPQQVRVGWRSGSSSQTTASIVTSGLILNLDAGNTTSYSGTGTTWTDLSSTGNNGTLTNGTAYSSVNGGALVFDGVNDYVNVASNPRISNTDFTYDFWFKINSNPDIYQTLISQVGGDYANYSVFAKYRKNEGTGQGRIFFQLQGFILLSTLSATDLIAAGNINYTAIAKKEGTYYKLYLYRNGVLDNSLNTTLTTVNMTLWPNFNTNIGRNSANNGGYGEYLDGNIYVGRVYNRALSTTEITQNFDATKTRFGYSTLDTDVQAFVTAASIVDATQQNAVNTLVTSLKSAGIWTKMKALYPFVGGSATSHKFNLKDPRDLDAAYRLVFNGGWVHSSNGALPNGTTGWATTYFNPVTQLTTQSSNHLATYLRTNINESTVDMGSFAGHIGLGYDIESRYSNVLYSFNGIQNDYVSFANTDSRGLFINTRTGNNVHKILINGVVRGTNTNNFLGFPNTNIALATRYNVSTGLPQTYSSKEQAFASIGDGLSDAEALAFYNAVQTYQTTLGRHVGVPIVADTDAQTFLNAAVITDSTQASAVNTLVTSLKTAGVWTKMKALYPFVGGSATSHKFNLKDPRDLDAAFRLQFNGGWVHSSTGALPNGTTGYANTYLNPFVVFGNGQSHLVAGSTHSLVHVSKYSRTNSIPSNGYDGVYSNGGSGASYMFFGWSSTYGSPNGYAALNGWALTGTRSAVTLGNRTDGLFVVNRDGFTSLKSFRNNTLISTDTNDIRSYNETGLQLNLNPNQVFFIGARNDAYDLNLRSFAYNNFETSFQSIGWGLTDAETTALNTAVQAFQTTLGRAV